MNFETELSRFNPDPALREWLVGPVKELLDRVQNDAELAALAEELQVLRLKNQALILELAHYKRLRFIRTSEQFDAEQRVLFEETWDTDICAISAEVEQIVPQAKDATPKRAHQGRNPLPDHLPRIEHRHEPESCACGQCGKEMVKIGEDVTEQLDVEPAQFFVHRHIRPQYACRGCETVAAAPVPPAIIDGGLASPGLLSWVAISKFADHLPLYRIEQIAARSQVVLSRSSLSDWVGRIGVALQPLADRLAEKLRAQAILHADETPVRQLDPGKGKTKRAYLWAYRSNDLSGGPPMVVFDYQTSRSGSHARTFLGEWKGHLMVDDYGGYKALFRKGVTELACLAHARRKFFDLHTEHKSPIAGEALQWIARLYAIEQEGQTLDVATREVLRLEKSVPLLSQYHEWLMRTRQTVAQGSATQKAIDYSLKRWSGLIRYAQSGAFPIDNNPVENSIRPIAIGKKNWLYAGSERAGRRAAAIQSLMGTARLNGLDPQTWLKATLEKLPAWPYSRIDELLPLKTA